MTDDLVTGRDYLTKRQYASDRNLAARQSIYAYQDPMLDIWSRAFELAALEREHRVLDIGCGNGRYLGALRERGHRGGRWGLDLSAGMLEAARPLAGPEAGLGVGDARTLPFRDHAFDVVLAMHMLYHVADRAAAVAEMRRVLAPQGRAVVLTNSAVHLDELDAALAASARRAGMEDPPIARSYLSFTAENGTDVLGATFDRVERHDLTSQLHITDVEPVLAYAESMRAFVVDDDGDLEPVLANLAEIVRATIDRDGEFRARTAMGMFVCS